MIDQPVNKETAVRFHELYTAEPTTGCWLWTGAVWKDRGGYGRIFFKRKGYRAHRFSWVLHKGKIPSGYLVCHRCDTPACVNPSHLFLGSNDENMKDMVRKNRQSIKRGSEHGAAKLSDADILKIRDMIKNNVMSQRKIAKAYGVSPALICVINKRVRWSHI